VSVSNIERETIILFNEAEDTVSVYTFNPTLKRKLGDFSEKYPALCKKTAEDSLGSVTYTVAKDRLSISLRAPLSEEKKEALRERGKKLFERLKEKQSSKER
jgi:hypothetical protein